MAANIAAQTRPPPVWRVRSMDRESPGNKKEGKMQRDLHYYGIGALARAAGFNRDDALTIAYASQYTDD